MKELLLVIILNGTKAMETTMARGIETNVYPDNQVASTDSHNTITVVHWPNAS